MIMEINPQFILSIGLKYRPYGGIYLRSHNSDEIFYKMEDLINYIKTNRRVMKYNYYKG